MYRYINVYIYTQRRRTASRATRPPWLRRASPPHSGHLGQPFNAKGMGTTVGNAVKTATRPPWLRRAPAQPSPAPCTLHPTPCTLYPKPFILHPPWKSRHSSSIQRPTPSTVNDRPCPPLLVGTLCSLPTFQPPLSMVRLGVRYRLAAGGRERGAERGRAARRARYGLRRRLCILVYLVMCDSG
jgi:hypothetical protein